MKTIKVPKARVSTKESFTEFEMQCLNDVEVYSNRGKYTTGDKIGQPKGDMFKGTCKDGHIRIMMADELAGVNQAIINANIEVVKAQLPAAQRNNASKVREGLMAFAHLAPLHTEDGFIAEEGEDAVYNEKIEIGRTSDGLTTV